MTLGNSSNFHNFSCDDIIIIIKLIKNIFSEKNLGLAIDNNLDFSDHISNICKNCKSKTECFTQSIS